MHIGTPSTMASKDKKLNRRRKEMQKTMYVVYPKHESVGSGYDLFYDDAQTLKKEGFGQFHRFNKIL